MADFEGKYKLLGAENSFFSGRNAVIAAAKNRLTQLPHALPPRLR